MRIGRSTLRGPPGGSPQLITLTAVLVMALTTACGVVPIFPPSLVEYTFVEDFNGPAGTGPDESKWTFDVGGGGWGNGELQTYTRSRANSFLDAQQGRLSLDPGMRRRSSITPRDSRRWTDSRRDTATGRPE